jgi:SAM-dependent methyltransferase
VQREGLGNVRPVLGRGSDPHLPVAALDAVLVVGVVHEIEDRVALFRNLGRSLKPGGRLGVVDFRPGDSGPGPAAAERVAAETIEAEATRAGLRLQRAETFLPFQYFLIFGRADATTAVSGTARTPARRTAAAPPRRRP